MRKITKIVATRCQILRLKCTKFDFGWGSAPDPAGELTAIPQTPYLDLIGPILLRGWEKREGRRGEGMGGKEPSFRIPARSTPWAKAHRVGDLVVVGCLHSAPLSTPTTLKPFYPTQRTQRT